jgi:ERCC4-type nuclease
MLTVGVWDEKKILFQNGPIRGRSLMAVKAQKADAPVVVIDTREQNPLGFTLPTERGTLTTGDYSIRGLEMFVAVERKSADDLVGSLKGQNRERFERELSRGRGLDYFCLVVESDLRTLAAGQYCSNMTPASVVQSLLAFSVRYNLPIFFCPDRPHAGRVVESLLTKYVDEIHKRMKAATQAKADGEAA